MSKLDDCRMSEFFSQLADYACWFVVTVLIFSVGCNSSASVGENLANHNRRIQDNMKDVRQDVRTFARDEGNLVEEAWGRLSAHPRAELIDSLLKIQQGAKDDSLSIDVSFVLCNLDHEYDANRRVIVSAFTRAKSHAIGEERLIDRLIKRGDKQLLPVLFLAAQDSDGALSEALAETFARELREDPEQFFIKLAAESSSSRKRIYEILVETLSDEDTQQVEKAIDSYPRKSAQSQIARELLEALSANGRIR